MRYRPRLRRGLPQRLVAHLPSDRLNGIEVGSAVFADLNNAKVFAPEGDQPAVSDELATS